jgi:hypothetical protein
MSTSGRDQPGVASADPSDRLQASVFPQAPPVSGEGHIDPDSLRGPFRPHALRLGICFGISLLGSFYLHEIGHCMVAWTQGCPAVPTPLKEYFLRPLPATAQHAMALGGIAGTVLALLGALWWMLRSPSPTRSAILAGAMTAPGFYTIRFLLAGRGHDATEFQEAQAAMGFSYAGHALDWIFLGLLFGTTAAWFWRTRARLTLRLAGRMLAGAFVALVAVALLQSVNNAVFDPLFERPIPTDARGDHTSQ